jgi:hypothetical protein
MIPTQSNEIPVCRFEDRHEGCGLLGEESFETRPSANRAAKKSCHVISPARMLGSSRSSSSISMNEFLGQRRMCRGDGAALAATSSGSEAK